MNSEEKELLFTARWLTRERFSEPKTRVDLLAILNMLLSDSPAVTPTPAPAPSDRKRPVVAVVVGHNSKAPGADALPPIGTSEFVWNTKIADRMAELGVVYGLDVRKFHRFAANSYTAEIKAAYQGVNECNALACIELHWNSASPSATGTETLHSGSPKSKSLATSLQKRMLAALELRDRGLKEVSLDDRGGLSVHSGKAPCVIVEPFFGSNGADVTSAHRLGIDGFAKVYLLGLWDYIRSL
jgi:N-acetylmuramoyl-L-alanine amidase